MWSVKSVRTCHVSALVSSFFFSGCIIHRHAGVPIYLCSFFNGTLFRLFQVLVDITNNAVMDSLLCPCIHISTDEDSRSKIVEWRGMCIQNFLDLVN